MEESKKMVLLEDVMEQDEGSLTPDTVLANLPNWDSMTRLSLIVTIDDECGKTLSGEQVRSFKTVKDILDFMG